MAMAVRRVNRHRRGTVPLGLGMIVGVQPPGQAASAHPGVMLLAQCGDWSGDSVQVVRD